MWEAFDQLNSSFENRPVMNLTDTEAIQKYNEWLQNINSLLDVVLKYN